MAAYPPAPWHPDRRWADPLIALLGVMILYLVVWRVRSFHRMPVEPPARIGPQARLVELRQAAQDLARNHVGGFLARESTTRLGEGMSSPWDRALCAILAAEAGNRELGRSLAMEGDFPDGDGFRRCYSAAYLSRGTPPAAEERAAVGRSLRGGYAARLLEARLAEDPGAAPRIRAQARAWALPRLVGLSAAGLAFLLLVPSGLAMAIVLAASAGKPNPVPIPRPRLPGRALVLVFLGWFLAFLSSGIVVGGVMARVPSLRPFALPLTYGFHAIVGLALVCRAEGLSPTGFWKRSSPGSRWKSLAWGFGFLALGVVMVLAVSLLLDAFLEPQAPPQQELLDLVAGARGAWSLALLFLTVSVAAPVFEEGLFRGMLLPWLGYSLETFMGVRSGWAAALLLSSLGFGIIHLEPAAVPVLSTLGAALGLAFLRTRNLGTSILVHGLWNGGVFLFYRVVMG